MDAYRTVASTPMCLDIRHNFCHGGFYVPHPTGRRRLLGAAAAITALVLAGLPARPAAAAPGPCPDAVPIGQVTEGMTGSGLTVAEGTTPSAFTAEVVGILPGGIAPGVDMILAELDSSVIDAAGGVWEGMSGSPVYSTDDRLIGAVAYGLAEGGSKLAGLVPGETLLGLSDLPAAEADAMAARARKVTLPAGLRTKAVRRAAATPAQAASGLRRLRVPLAVSGLPAKRLAALEAGAAKSGLAVRPYAARAADATVQADPTEIVAGGNIAAALSSGDVTTAAVGTVTAVCDGVALGFGHPLLHAGRTGLAAHVADALAIQPGGSGPPFKVAAPGGVVGVVDQDRTAGIRAPLGDGPATTTVQSTVTAPETSRNRVGTTEISYQDGVPGLAAEHLAANIDQVLDSSGEGTASVTWTAVGVTDAGAPWGMTRTNLFSVRDDIALESSEELAGYLATLVGNQFTKVRVTGVTITASATESYQRYQVERIQVKTPANKWVDAGPSKPILATAGRTMNLRILLSTYQSSAPLIGVTLSVAVPGSAKGRIALLRVSGGQAESGYTDYCLFDPSECAAAAPAASSFVGLQQTLIAQPRNNQVRASLFVGGGDDDGLDAAARGAADTSRVVAGASSTPVLIR